MQHVAFVPSPYRTSPISHPLPAPSRSPAPSPHLMRPPPAPPPPRPSRRAHTAQTPAVSIPQPVAAARPLAPVPSAPAILWLRPGWLRLADNRAVAAAAASASATPALLPVLTVRRRALTPAVRAAATDLALRLRALASGLVVHVVDDTAPLAEAAALSALAARVRARTVLVNVRDRTHAAQLCAAARAVNGLPPLSCFPDDDDDDDEGDKAGEATHFARRAPFLCDAPATLPPLPRAVRLLSRSELEWAHAAVPRGEVAARSLLRRLLATGYTSLPVLRASLQQPLCLGCLSETRLVFEASRARLPHCRPVRYAARGPLQQLQECRRVASRALAAFFAPLAATPALASTAATATAALSVVAYDVNGGDRRGVEWDDTAKCFVLKEWEHTETERRMNPRERVREFVRRRRLFLMHAFFPEDVTPDYYSFTAWRFAQRCVTATIGVFGTSSLLLALGIRSGRIGQAAVVSWVLKDGLGRVGKMVWAGSMGRDFDVDPKRWRFRSALLYALGNGLEIVTQIFPASFLVFATAANSMKQVSFLTSSATRNAMYRSFGEKSQNIANITAKGEAQIVVADLIGMALGIRLSKIFSSRANVLSAYCFLTVLDIFGIYMELRQVVFRSINAERASIIINRSLKRGMAPTPGEVSPRENIFLTPRHANWVRMTSIAKAARNPQELEMLLRVFRRERFLVAMPRAQSGGPCRLVLRKDATNEDVLRAMLLVGHVQKSMRMLRRAKSTLTEEERERLLESARRSTNRMFASFVKSLKKRGWDTDSLLFGTMKRRGFWARESS